MLFFSRWPGTATAHTYKFVGVEQQIARYFRRLSAVTKIGLLTRSLSVNMNDDEEADADDLASEVETDRTRQKIRRGLAKFRRRLQQRVQLLLS